LQLVLGLSAQTLTISYYNVAVLEIWGSLALGYDIALPEPLRILGILGFAENQVLALVPTTASFAV
jgi:hypothetical protein